MTTWLMRGLIFIGVAAGLHGASGPGAVAAEAAAPKPKRVYILPVREEIMPPLVYLLRRGVKEAMDNQADLLVLDMETNGGRVDVTEEILGVLGRFKGETVTYVNRKAFSAGAFIAVATRKIYMAPQSVIGAAAPILMMPGAGVEKLPETMEAKMTSGIKALVRATAKKNGHNPDVIEAMIDRSKDLTIDGEVLNKEGQILTLDDEQAARQYGTPPKPLLSLGTVETLDALLGQLGYAGASRTRIEPLGAEKLASWISMINPILLIIGIAGLYIEFKTPGFGLPGIVGISAFAIYFFGGYVAGLAGLEWLALFILGLGLVALELLVFPGIVVLAVAGGLCMLIALIMGTADLYPAPGPGMPALPSLPQIQMPLQDLFLAGLGSIVVVWLLSRWLPRTAAYGALVSTTASGVRSVADQEQARSIEFGQQGVALSALRPGGKAQFGDRILDVMTEGGFLERGQPVRIVGHSGTEAIVEAVNRSAS
jgi:membrane-bound serine protease (ClpP class)